MIEELVLYCLVTCFGSHGRASDTHPVDSDASLLIRSRLLHHSTQLHPPLSSVRPLRLLLSVMPTRSMLPPRLCSSSIKAATYGERVPAGHASWGACALGRAHQTSSFHRVRKWDCLFVCH